MPNVESSGTVKSEPSPQRLRDFADAVGAFLRTLSDCYWIADVQKPRFLPDVKRELVGAITRVERSHNPECRPIKNPDRGFWKIENWPEPERLHRIYRWIRLSIDRVIVDWGLVALCSGQPWVLRADDPPPWVNDEPEGVVVVKYDPVVGWPRKVDRDLVEALAAAQKQLNEYLDQYSQSKMESPKADDIREQNPTFVAEPEKRIVRWGKTVVPINSHADFQVMCTLIDAEGDLVSYADLFLAVKPRGLSPDVHKLEECPQEVKDAVAHIRKALKKIDAPAKVVTVKRVGFRLVVRSD